ncbi:BatD family protein [Hymenobacter sp. BT491]|uniref:BatD family protein n=1 Tax=Hymenobacter sp. BT491 TaxID=2766779 RepID=UPI001653E454|nr:BatD family protein [Hymenobacter sp. BT491]MBC6990748.1 BatD family protein [Hymenobacter sp. BT491]
MLPFIFRFLLLCVLLMGSYWAEAQVDATGQAEIELGKVAFPVNEYFTISFHLRGAPLERYSAFPDLEGFKKSGKSSTTTTRITGGQTTTELTITQRYAAFAEGEFVIKPFTMTVNGQVVRSAGATLKVGPVAAAQAPSATAPPGAGPLQGIGLLDQLFGKPRPQDYIEPHDNAFLALVADKNSVYVGEGVHIGLYFYLTPSDQGLLDFHNFAGQLPDLLRRMRQRTAWEEPFEEQEILPETIVAGGKKYLRYRLYEAEYYPLNNQPLVFPALPLQMVKYRVAKKPEAGSDNRLEGYKIYYSDARTVTVKPLPPHPLRDQVPVGNYQLREAIDRTAFRTGQVFTYTFRVEGEGNLAALSAPVLRARPKLEVYGPDVQQDLTRQGGRVGGAKVFSYRMVAQQPGVLPLDSVLSLVVFNPSTARYDTLRPEIRPDIGGSAKLASGFHGNPDDPFYADVLNNADNHLQPLDEYRNVRLYANLVLVLLAAIAGFGWWRKKM